MSTHRQFRVEQIRCPYCDEPAPLGATVCRGCRSEIVYGATSQERSDYFAGAFVLGLVVAAFLFTHIWWAYPLVGLLTMLMLARVDVHAGEIRYFRRFRYN